MAVCGGTAAGIAHGGILLGTLYQKSAFLFGT
jgi:hypothetical protein